METISHYITHPYELWFLPTRLATGNPGFQFLIALPCALAMFILLRMAYEDLTRVHGFVAAFFATVLIFWFPPLWLVYYVTLPLKERQRVQLKRAVQQDADPHWEEQGLGRWMQRQGWELAKDSLHTEQDLLAGKSKAAIQAHLEREMRELPQVDARVRYTEADRSSTIVTEEGEFELPPWESLGKINPIDQAQPLEVIYQPPPPPKYPPPQIEGVSDVHLDRLYAVGRFDEVVAFLQNRLKVDRIRGLDTTAVEDYLRIARSQQLHRELERFRAEYDREALLGPKQNAAE